ncbi:MAG TPA: hypothetical protein VK633_12980, partial [Verrucomicrobiae bacterium]|nr:hypothetical protein [Verrucomicrobiae bacterium]
MRAFFEGVKFADDLPIDRASEQKVIREHNGKLDQQIKPLEAERDSLTARVKAALRQGKIAQLPPEDQLLLTASTDEKSDEEKKRLESI